jgi:hypothetical protein
MSEPPVPAEPVGGRDPSDLAGAADALGERLAELVTEPAAFEAALRSGLRGLVDPTHAAALAVVSPAVSGEYAVRGPLIDLVQRPVRRSLREASSASAIWLAQRLVEADHRDLRLFALLPLRRALTPDPELTWQLLRRLGGRAGDWIEVDALADLWARGILAEPFRWAELDQLVYSQGIFERRLVGSTLATLPRRVPAARRHELRGRASGHALGLLGMLMGDAEALVQKSLAWAIRAWSPIDPVGVTALLREQAGLARIHADGGRAWVIRGSLSRQPADLAGELRADLAGIKRRAAAGSTSHAAETSARFATLLGARPEVVSRQGERYARSRA